MHLLERLIIISEASAELITFGRDKLVSRNVSFQIFFLKGRRCSLIYNTYTLQSMCKKSKNMLDSVMIRLPPKTCSNFQSFNCKHLFLFQRTDSTANYILIINAVSFIRCLILNRLSAICRRTSSPTLIFFTRFTMFFQGISKCLFIPSQSS